MHNDTSQPKPTVPYWMRGVLLLASFYNLSWAAFIYWFPDAFYRWVTQRTDDTPLIISWQAVGIFIFSILYFIAALYPVRFRYLIVIGILSKFFGAIWFYYDIMELTVNKKFLFHLIVNDLVWIPVFIVLAFKAFSQARAR
ncbi:hypothetical protein AB9P05_09790 [Roseivirga sp. BDSF3-8]|uniref:hypothetical protein n=1 Tax=Roseivirga sp. BDSF3-8 TaxID=3241598 RepID=UPI0035326B0E